MWNTPQQRGPHNTSNRVGTLEEDLHLSSRACSCLQPPRCKVPRGTHVKRFGLERHGNSGNLALQGKSTTVLPGAKVIT